MASAKLLGLGALGLIAAGALVYLVAFHDSGSPEATPAPLTSKPTETKPTPIEQPAVAEEKPGDARKSEGAAVRQMGGGIEGIVRDPQSAPVAGAKIELVKSNNVSLALALGKKTGPPETFSAKSGVDGKYQVRAPQGEGYTLIVTHPDFARYEMRSIAAPGEGFASYIVDMKGGTRVYGRVTEEGSKNRPLQGVQIVFDPPSLSTGFAVSVDSQRETTTDESGSYKFENVTPGSHKMKIKAAGYGTRDMGAVLVGSDVGHREDIFLKPAQSLAGRVVDANGHAVPKARVSATTGGIAGSSGETVANDLGEFVIRDIEENRYYVVAEAEGYGQGHAENPPIASGTVDVVVTMAMRASVQGIVREKGSNKPVTAFAVTVKRAMPNARIFPAEIGPLAMRSNDGTFTIQGLDPAMEHIVEVSADGYSNGTSERFAVQASQVTRGVEVFLPQGGTINGRVVDARTGKAVAGAVVKVKDNTWQDNSALPGFLGTIVEAQQARTSERSATTNENGSFTFTHVDEGICQVAITHPSYVLYQERDIGVQEAKTVDVGTLRLSSGAALHGTVYGEDGSPSPNAEVKIRMAAIIPGKGMVQKSVRCDATGKYSVKNLPSGDYQVSCIPNRPNGPQNDVFGGMIYAQKTMRQAKLSDDSDQELDLYIPAK